METKCFFLLCLAKEKNGFEPERPISKTHFSGTNGAEAAAVSKQPAEKLLVITERGSFIYAHSAARLIPLPHFPLADLLFNLFIFFFLSERSSLALLGMRGTPASTPGHHQWTSEYDEEKREGETGEQWGEGREWVLAAAGVFRRVW